VSWKVQESRKEDCMILEVSGRLESSDLSELRRVLGASSGSLRLALDLRGVRLVDRASVLLLAECEESGARLLNCPAYIREWITGEKADRPS
jgi:ABC-type transporter Mla MlaB component